FSIVSSKKPPSPGGAWIKELFRHLELNAEIDTPIDGLAVLHRGADVAGTGFCQIEGTFIQALTAGTLKDRRRLGQLAARRDADVHRRRALLAQALRGRRIIVFRIRESLAELRIALRARGLRR